MRFHTFPEEALGSRVKVKLLLHLLSDNVPTSERELAGMLGVSHMAVNKTMKDFQDLNLVSPMRVGNALAWKIKEQSYAYAVLKELKSLADNPPLKHLQGEIKSALGPYPTVSKVVIFGSVADGRELPNSDIDLLVIIGKEHGKPGILAALSKLAETFLLLYGNRLSPSVLTEREARSSRNRHVMKSAERGIVVMV